MTIPEQSCYTEGMDTHRYTTLSITRHVLRVMDKVQKGHLAEVWTETVDYQDTEQDRLDVESLQDFLRRVASAEPGTIENAQDYIILQDRVVQEENGSHIFHSLKADRFTASLTLDFRSA